MKRIFIILLTIISLGVSMATAQTTKGTYEVKDNHNKIWTIILKSDFTATAKLNGSNHVNFGSWKDSSKSAPYITLQFPSEDNPALEFPIGRNKHMHWYYINNGYLYQSYSGLKAANPRLRLPIKKIK